MSNQRARDVGESWHDPSRHKTSLLVWLLRCEDFGAARCIRFGMPPGIRRDGRLPQPLSCDGTHRDTPPSDAGLGANRYGVLFAISPPSRTRSVGAACYDTASRDNPNTNGTNRRGPLTVEFPFERGRPSKAGCELGAMRLPTFCQYRQF